MEQTDSTNQPQMTTPDESGNSSGQSPQLLLKKKTVTTVIAVIVGILLVGGLYVMHSHQVAEQSRQVIADEASAQNAYGKGNFAEAKKIAADGLKLKPKDKQLLQIMIQSIASEANSTGNKKLLTEADPYIKTALDAYPNDPDILSAVGYRYEVDGKFDQALQYYKSALAADPNNATIVFHIGHIYEQEGKQKDAFAEYDKAYALNKKDPLVLFGKAREALFTNKLDDAVIYYKAVSDQKTLAAPARAEALSSQALIRGDQLLYPSQAVSLAKQAVDADPTFAPAVAAYGFEHGRYENVKEGLEWLDKAIAINPDISGFYYQKGYLDQGVKRYNAAVADFKQAIATADTDPTLLGQQTKNSSKGIYYYNLALTYSLANTGHIPDIISWLQQAIALNPLMKHQLQYDWTNAHAFNNFDKNTSFHAFIQTVL